MVAINDTGSEKGRGHRGRLRSRIQRPAEHALEDHELLELLLTFVIPRVDTRPLAVALLQRFHGISGVLAAEAHQLQEVPGIGPRVSLILRLIPLVMARSLVTPRNGQAVFRSPEEAGHFFRVRFSGLQEEQVHAAFLNSKNRLLAVECLHEGTVDHSVVYPRRVLERSLIHRASGFILAHNHPSGDPTPSAHDIQLTESLSLASRSLGVRFLDHLIIGEGEPYSLRSHGFLDRE